MPHTIARSSLLVLVLACLVPPTHGAPKKDMPNPDFTKGDTIPKGAVHDWNLGATGARGWMFSHKLETTRARQIAITKVDPGSPADGILKVGDVILGVAGQPFTHDPRVEFGSALTRAESTEGNGALTLTRWRDGKAEEITIQMPVLGDYSPTAPYDCPKSKTILERGCKALAERMQKPEYEKSQNAITRSLNALALLSSGDPSYLPVIRREVEWASNFSADSFQVWWNAYVIMLLAEYKIATGDATYEAGLRRLAMESAKGQSIVGSWGHRFAGEDGRLVGYGMMNAPGVPLTISLIMTRQAGVKDPAIDLAIERSAKLLRFYIGKGAVPYGDHAPWTQTHEDNGKCGMAGVMFNFLEEKNGAEFFSRMSVAAHGPERDTGHTGNFTNMAWAMPGVALSGPQATGAWMHEFGARYYDMARTWDGRFPHPGPPEVDGDAYRNWDSTGAYLLAYAMPLKKILLTGKQPNIAPQIDTKEAASLLADGRGWSNADRNSAYDQLDPDTLLEKLGSWSSAVRERAAMAIARRKGEKPIAALVAMLDSPNLQARYGACEALIQLKPDDAAVVTKLTSLLDHEDLWLRIKAAESLASIGPPAMGSLPKMLERLAVGPTKEDPRGMEQRFLCFSVFGKMLSHSLDGVDRDALFKAVRAGLHNEDGRARGSIVSVYRNLSWEEIRPLLPAIHEAVVKPSPSGIMFADQIRMEGLELLVKHHVEEGMAACVGYMAHQNKWGSEKRMVKLIDLLLQYGTHASRFIPQLEAIAIKLDGGEVGFPEHLTKQKAANLRACIKAIQAAKETPGLTRIP